jgi:DNA polymerase elongation subunit (family B)
LDELPKRENFVTEDRYIEYEEERYLLFIPSDVIETSHNGEYAILMCITLHNGERVNVTVKNISLELRVKVLDDEDFDEEKSIELTVMSVQEALSDHNIHHNSYTIEIEDKYESMEFKMSKEKFITLRFKNAWTRKNANNALHMCGKKTYSNMNKYIYQYLTSKNKSIADWSIISNFSIMSNGCYLVNEEYFINLNPPLEEVDTSTDTVKYFRTLVPQKPKIIVLSWDIECYSSTGSLPDPKIKKDEMFMIAGGFHYLGEHDPLITFCITYCSVDWEKETDEGINKETYYLIKTEDEQDLIMAFAHLIKRFNPEYRLAFNNYTFDDKYMCERSIMYGVFKEVTEITTNIPLRQISNTYRTTDFCKETFNKMEAGFSQSQIMWIIPGSFSVDMMVALRKANPRDEFLESHALRSYLERYKLPNKLDVTPHEMWEAFENGDGVSMKKVADYCVIDGLSCQRLQAMLNIIKAKMSLAHISYCSIGDCFLRADGMRVKNLIYHVGGDMGFVYNDDKPDTDGHGYPGAYVFKPLKGIYRKLPIICYDFESLYPSIMRALNLSSETVTYSKDVADAMIDKGYDVFEYRTVYDDIDRTMYYIRKNPDGSRYQGVYPECLEKLLKFRKLYKKEMGKHRDKFYSSTDSHEHILWSTCVQEISWL